MVSELQDVSRILERLIKNSEAQLSITIETGHDEAGLVGTNDAYLRLAKTVVDFVAAAELGEAKKWDIFGRQLAGSDLISDVFDSSCEVVLDTACLTMSEQDTQDISERFKQGSPRG